MPLGRMMEERNFDSKSAVILVEAFNEIIDELDLRTIADRERAAKIVVELAASKTALDVAELRDEAVDLIRKGDVTLGLRFGRESGRTGRRRTDDLSISLAAYKAISATPPSPAAQPPQIDERGCWGAGPTGALVLCAAARLLL